MPDAEVLGAGSGGPLPPISPWQDWVGWIQYKGPVVVGPGAPQANGTINAVDYFINGAPFDFTTVVARSGSTMTGPLVLPGNPTTALQATTKQYVDAGLAVAGQGVFLPLSGGTMTGLLVLSGPPTAPLNAATKAYADTMVPLAGG